MAAGGGYDGEKMSDDGVVDEGQRRRGKEKQRLFAGKRSNGCLLRLCVFFFLLFFCPGLQVSPFFYRGAKGAGLHGLSRAAWGAGQRGGAGQRRSAGRRAWLIKA